MHSNVCTRGFIVALMMIAALHAGHSGATEPLNIEGDGWHTWHTEGIGKVGPEVVGELRVFVLLESGTVRKIDVLSQHCEIRVDATITDYGTPADHGFIEPAESIDWLQQHILDDSSLSSDALAAVSLHGGAPAFHVLRAIIESDFEIDIREEALFWLVQVGSDDAFEYIDMLLTGS